MPKRIPALYTTRAAAAQKEEGEPAPRSGENGLDRLLEQRLAQEPDLLARLDPDRLGCAEDRIADAILLRPHRDKLERAPRLGALHGDRERVRQPLAYRSRSSRLDAVAAGDGR